MRTSFTVLLATLLAVVVWVEPLRAEEQAYDVDGQFMRGVRLAQNGNFTGSLRIFREVAEHEPGWTDLWYNMGQVATFAERWYDCSLAYRRYLSMGVDERSEREARSALRTCEVNIANPARLTLTAESPASMRVVYDGLVVLEAPGTITLLVPPGTHALEASATDHIPTSHSVEAVADEEVSWTPSLQMETFYGTLQVDVEQGSGTLLVDGRRVGTLPLEEPVRIETGRRLISIEAEGFHPWQRYVNIERDGEEQLEIRLISDSVDLDDL